MRARLRAACRPHTPGGPRPARPAAPHRPRERTLPRRPVRAPRNKAPLPFPPPALLPKLLTHSRSFASHVLKEEQNGKKQKIQNACLFGPVLLDSHGFRGLRVASQRQTVSLKDVRRVHPTRPLFRTVQAAATRRCGPGGSDGGFFFPVREAGAAQAKPPGDPGPGEGPRPGMPTATSVLRPQVAEREREHLVNSSPPNAPPPNTIALLNPAIDV